MLLNSFKYRQILPKKHTKLRFNTEQAYYNSFDRMKFIWLSEFMIQHLHSFPFTFWSLSFNVQRCIPDKKTITCSKRRTVAIELWWLCIYIRAFTCVLYKMFTVHFLIWTQCTATQLSGVKSINRDISGLTLSISVQSYYSKFQKLKCYT